MLPLITADISPYTLLHYAMKIAGYMNNDGRPWSLIYSCFQVILMSTFGALAFLEVIYGNKNLEKLVLALSAVAIFIQLYVKLLAMMFNENKIRDLLNRLEQYRTELLNDEQYREQIINADQICRKYSKYFISLFLSFPIISFISNFIVDYSTNFEDPHLPHQIWIPWNKNEFWGYTAAAVTQLVMNMSGGFIYASCSVFQLIFTFQITTYLKILQDRLETKGPANPLIYLHHKKLNQFLMDYNDIYSGQLFVEITVASLMPCGFGYTIIKGFKSNNPPAVDTYHFLILCCSGPFFMYYCGQEISTQMERLHESSYMSNWYEEKPKVRRDLYTMMLITIRPVTMNYRMFITFDLKCGTAIVQGIYSYLMMINNFEAVD